MPFCREDLAAWTNTGYMVSDGCHRGKVYFRYYQSIHCYTLWQNPCIYAVLPHFSRKSGEAVKLWHKWLQRRNRTPGGLTWERMNRLLKETFVFPYARVVHAIYNAKP